MIFGLVFTSLYLIATFLRPQELFPELAGYNIMDWLGALALVATLFDVLTGARPSVRHAQTILLAFFVFWSAFTVAAAWRWLGGAAFAFQALSIDVFIFVLIVLNGHRIGKLDVMRYVTVAAVLVTVAFGLRAYYRGPTESRFVMTQRARSAESQGGVLSRMGAVLMGRTAGSVVDGEETDPQGGFDGDVGGGERAQAGPRVRRLRALGFLNDPNDFAQALVALLPIAFLAWRPRSPFRILLLVLVPTAVMLWAVWLTRSRGGLIALFGLCWFAVSERLTPRWGSLMRWLGSFGLLIVLIVFFRSGADGSAMGRLEAWSAGLQMLKGSPVWGVGFGTFGEEHELVAHNSFVHCFAELGLVGYFLWLGAIIATLWSLDRIRQTPDVDPDAVRWATALRASLVAFLIGALFLSRTYSVTLYFILGLATALAGAVSTAPSEFSMPLFKLAVRTASVLVVSILLTYLVILVGR